MPWTLWPARTPPGGVSLQRSCCPAHNERLRLLNLRPKGFKDSLCINLPGWMTSKPTLMYLQCPVIRSEAVRQIGHQPKERSSTAKIQALLPRCSIGPRHRTRGPTMSRVQRRLLETHFPRTISTISCTRACPLALPIRNGLPSDLPSVARLEHAVAQLPAQARSERRALLVPFREYRRCVAPCPASSAGSQRKRSARSVGPWW